MDNRKRALRTRALPSKPVLMVLTLLILLATSIVMLAGMNASAAEVNSNDNSNSNDTNTSKVESTSTPTLNALSGSSGITSIDTFVTQYVTGGTATTNSSGGSDYVWNTTQDVSGHRFTFRVNFATSGVGSVAGAELDDNGNVKDGSYGTIQIRVPKSILLDRDGKQADEFEMSVPEGTQISQMSDDIKKDQHYAYSIDGDDIVFYNWDTVTAGQNGYFEISYLTTESTQHYLDYDGKTDSSYNDASKAFNAKITAGSLTKTSDDKYVYINTSATISSVTKKMPDHLIRSWDSSWGTKPSDADDYYYLVWEIDTYITKEATSYYDFTLTDVPSSTTGDVEVVGYKLQGSSTFTSTNTVKDLTSDGYRYDFVLTRHKKSTFDKDSSGNAITQYTINNKITATVHPKDGVDADTSATAVRKYDWTKPTWGAPSGHFQMWKDGNENWHERHGYYWDYASYDLDQIQDNKASSLDNIKYYIESIGYPFPWTQDTSSADATSTDPAKIASTYGQKEIKNSITDDTLYLLKSDNNTFWNWNFDQDTDSSKETPLTADDYDFSSIVVSMSAQDVARDSNGKPTYNTDTAGFDVSTHTLDSNDILTVETGTNGTWSTAGTLNMGTGVWTAATGSKVSSTSKNSSSSYTINFSDGVDGYRISTTNKYYMTWLGVYVYVSLKNTSNVLSVTGSGTAAEDQVLLKNKAQYDASYKDGTDWKNIISLRRIIGDRLRRTERSSSVTKEVSAHKNNVLKQRYEITWRVKEEETYRNGTGDSSTVNYVQQQGGTFYDLLPEGANFKQDSLVVDDGYTQLKSNQYSYELVQNWRNSGRTMLIVHITQPGNNYIVYYTTTHAWTALKDYGIEVKNPVGYETGNDSITNGLPDDGSTLSDANKQCYTDLDSTTNAKKFIYSEANDEIAAITAAQSGLKKQVIASNDSDWSYSTITTPSAIYRYRLRFENTYITKAKNMIFYDSLENYKPEGKTSDWHGTLQGIDTSQLTALGINPVVYLSATENLDMSNTSNTDLTNTSIWLTQAQFVAKYGSLASAKAVAIDLRKQTSGADYVLPEGQSVTAVLVMKAPDSAPTSVKTGYPYTYNNIYIKDTVIDNLGGTADFYIHQDYTTVKYAITADFKLHKVNKNNEMQNVPNISFRLFGTSDYGTAIDTTSISDSDGIVSFKNIEKGTYTLMETEGNADWLEDHTPHTVVIDNSKNVTIDGTTVYDASTDTTTPFKITNAPRVHADVYLEKVDSIYSSTKVANATYRLSGTSDYGNAIAMYATSDKTGNLTFSNVEKGTYTIKESEAPDGYIKNNTEYRAIIDETGSVKVQEYKTTDDTVTKYSHTSNVSDDGTQNGNYGSNLNTNEVITIPNAEKLHVKIVYGGESADYDWVCMWEGSHSDYTAANNYSTSRTGKLGGGSHTASSNTKEYDVTGDTVTFAFRSDSSGYGDGYGYYAVITGYVPNKGWQDVVQDTSNLSYIVKDEPYHYIVFVKRSSYDSSAVEGAEFSLKGTSDYGTAVDMTATSDDIGEVRFNQLEPGTYVLVETKAPDGYELNTEQHIVKMNSDGTYTISGLSKS